MASQTNYDSDPMMVEGLRGQSTSIALTICAAVLLLGCDHSHKLSPPPEALKQPVLRFGPLVPGGEGATLSYHPFAVPGAIVHENISSNLASEGVPPAHIEVRAKGRWGGSAEKPTLEIEELTLKPENAPIAKDIKAQLEKGTPPEHLPLAVLSLLGTPAADQPSPIRLPVLAGSPAENLDIQGVWVCSRQDGAHQSGAPARRLECVMEEGEALQRANSQDRTKHRRGRLLGALTAVWSSGAEQTAVSVEEVRLHLLAWSQEPRPTKIELHYHRQGCLNEDYCPILQ